METGHALRPLRLIAVLVAALAVGACTSGGAQFSALPTTSPSPDTSAIPAASGGPGASASTPAGSAAPPASPAASGSVATAADAFAAVQARSPFFDGIKPKSPGIIGQSAWWGATAGADGAWDVTVSVGWGDCPSGCIDHRGWRYTVAADGTVAFVGESGAPLPAQQQALLVVAAKTSGVGGTVTAGPTCPVVRPGASGCDDRPVAAAVLLVKDAGGSEVARFTTDASGLFRIALAPGSYTLEPQAVAGILGNARPAPFTVEDAKLTLVAVSYDTGIR